MGNYFDWIWVNYIETKPKIMKSNPFQNVLKNDPYLEELDHPLFAQFGHLLNQDQAGEIIGFDWEGFPLRANIVRLLYSEHLEKVQEGEFIEEETVIRHFNEQKYLSNRIYTMGS